MDQVLKKKEQAHDVMAKRLEIAEALSTRTVKLRLLKCFRSKSGLVQRWRKG